MANELNMAKIDAILALHQRHWSIRRIAKELGITRASVARHIRQSQQPSKQARAPIGSATVMPGAKQATIQGGAHEANQATPEGGAHEANQARAPIGSAEVPATKNQQASLCEPWRQVIVSKLAAGLTAQRIYQDL